MASIGRHPIPDTGIDLTLENGSAFFTERQQNEFAAETCTGWKLWESCKTGGNPVGTETNAAGLMQA